MSDLRLLEMSLAYEHAGDAITNYCLLAEPAGALEEGWYDLNAVDGDDADLKALVAEAALYLDSRGLLQHHAEHPSWVIVSDEGEPVSVDEKEKA